MISRKHVNVDAAAKALTGIDFELGKDNRGFVEAMDSLIMDLAPEFEFTAVDPHEKEYPFEDTEPDSKSGLVLRMNIQSGSDMNYWDAGNLYYDIDLAAVWDQQLKDDDCPEMPALVSRARKFATSLRGLADRVDADATEALARW